GIAFLDYDNDGYKDIFVANGHVLDNIAELDRSTACPQRNLLLRNLGNGTFADVTERAGPGLSLRKASRAVAIGDYDNDGDIDILVTNWNQTPDLLRNDGGNQNHWIQIRAVGTQGNRSGIGAKIKVVAEGLTQYGEVHSGGSYLAFSDLCVHFGLAKSEVVDRVEIRWPSGQTDTAKNLPVNRRYVAIEGKGLKGDERR
ncbi:MAG: CRTAC1 family protein, partial [Planctomycetes bacterium]|nr:CRTAC1 family protein [Planctomycetota bacterium]